MKFKYISHAGKMFRLRTVKARDEDSAWEILDKTVQPDESGFLISMADWKRILRRDKT